jgi:hypothetical protein
MDMSFTGVRSVTSEFYHGNDGMGDVPDSSAPSSGHLHEEHAALALVRLANQYPGNFGVRCVKLHIIISLKKYTYATGRMALFSPASFGQFLLLTFFRVYHCNMLYCINYIRIGRCFVSDK